MFVIAICTLCEDKQKDTAIDKSQYDNHLGMQMEEELKSLSFVTSPWLVHHHAYIYSFKSFTTSCSEQQLR